MKSTINMNNAFDPNEKLPLLDDVDDADEALECASEESGYTVLYICKQCGTLAILALLCIVLLALFPFSLAIIFFAGRKAMIPIAGNKSQSEFIILEDKQNPQNLSEKLIDSQSKNITVIFGGNGCHMDQHRESFRNDWSEVNASLAGTKVILVSYRDLPANWTQKKMQKWIAKKIATIENKDGGTVVNAYGHSMGGLMATEAYRQMQQRFSYEQQEKLKKQGYNKLIVDRSFADIDPVAAHIINIPTVVMSMLTRITGCHLRNPLFSKDPMVQKEIQTWDPENLTFIESPYDRIIPIQSQAGSQWRATMQSDQKKQSRHFIIMNPYDSHNCGVMDEASILTRINQYGEALRDVDTIWKQTQPAILEDAHHNELKGSINSDVKPAPEERNNATTLNLASLDTKALEGQEVTVN